MSNERLASPHPVREPLLDPDAAPALTGAPLQGRRISLIPMNAERDTPQLYEISHGTTEKESVWTHLGYGPFESEAEMRIWHEECQRSKDPFFYTVTDRETAQRMGVVSFLSIERSARRIEVGHIWYGTSFQRGHTNTEAVYILLREAFERLNSRRVEWKCDSRNERSRNAAERLGFQYEGTFRQHCIIKGRNRDTAWFSLLDREWLRAKRALETWLEWPEGRPPGLARLRNAAS